MPLLRPLIKPGDFLSGQNNQLFMRVDPSTLSAITQIIDHLDQPLANLLITVDYSRQTQQTTTEIKTRVNIIKQGRQPDHTTPPILQTSIAATKFSTADRDQFQQSIQVTEGYEALFNTQLQKPVIRNQLETGHLLLTHLATIEQQSAITGFTVIATLNNGAATLKIHPQQQTFSANGDLHSQQLDTTLTVPLAKWVEIGSNLTNSAVGNRGLLSRTKDRHDQQYSIKIRVDTIE